MFVLLEFRVKHDILALYFNFLDKPIGKGVYLIMMALIIIEVEQITEIIFSIIITIFGIFNIAIGITYEQINFTPDYS
jgi:hypothetical protein